MPSGSVYIQRYNLDDSRRLLSQKVCISGDIRYTYKHSIVHKVEEDNGQRLSIMIRVSTPLFGSLSDAKKSAAAQILQDLPPTVV